MRRYPSYSVLMSVYAKDNPAFLREAIESMVAQTVTFSDLVLVCDGPLSPALDAQIRNLQTQLGNRLVVHRLARNSGLGSALAAGLPLCTHDIVARMDSDDISRPKRCEILLDKMVSDGLDLIGGAIEEFEQIPGDMKSVRHTPLTQSDIKEFSRRRNPFNHMTVVFRRQAVLDAGGYQEFPYLEDYWLWVRMISNGCTCANVPDIVLDARVGRGMYARRSGLAYLQSQYALFCRFREMGYINRTEFVRAIFERTVASIIPTWALKATYNALLRRRP